MTEMQYTDAPTSTFERANILVVDDDSRLRLLLVRYFESRQYSVCDCGTPQEALDLADEHDFDVMILDLRLEGDQDGIQLLEQLRQRGTEAEVVMLTGQGTIESAVRAIKLGASEFVTKPSGLGDLERLVQKCVEARRLRKENCRLKAAIQREYSDQFNIIGESDVMQEVLRMIKRTANSELPVLILGESGTGKELVAKALHQASSRSETPLVTINCAALPEALLESELFGYEQGAFTGATTSKPGLFELADGGTMFVDELGELAVSLQAKLLRVLEDGSLRRLGSVKQRNVNVRIIAATNRELFQEVIEKRFREDLYYRLNALEIVLPPLREREGDVRLLAHYFAGFEWDIEPEVMNVIQNYSWPGNVRQLQNVIERARLLAEDETICLEHLPLEIRESRQENFSRMDLGTVNRHHIQEVYQRHHGNKTRTARALGIGRRSLYRLLEKFDIE